MYRIMPNRRRFVFLCGATIEKWTHAQLAHAWVNLFDAKLKPDCLNR
jgi:hypothetical protein